MAVSESKEVVIEATPKEILDVIADVKSSPKYTPAQQSVEILDTHDDGRPRQVKMTVKSAGITDECVIEYTWADNAVSWSLVSSNQQRTQDGKYTLTPQGDKTRVTFDLKVDAKVPLPGFVLKKAVKGSMNDATEGLRKYILSLK
jgi:ribosome-associated toxin RatA of RatAB toxin-antitoxin module